MMARLTTSLFLGSLLMTSRTLAFCGPSRHSRCASRGTSTTTTCGVSSMATVDKDPMEALSKAMEEAGWTKSSAPSPSDSGLSSARTPSTVVASTAVADLPKTTVSPRVEETDQDVRPEQANESAKSQIKGQRKPTTKPRPKAQPKTSHPPPKKIPPPPVVIDQVAVRASRLQLDENAVFGRAVRPRGDTYQGVKRDGTKMSHTEQKEALQKALKAQQLQNTWAFVAATSLYVALPFCLFVLPPTVLRNRVEDQWNHNVWPPLQEALDTLGDQQKVWLEDLQTNLHDKGVLLSDDQPARLRDAAPLLVDRVQASVQSFVDHNNLNHRPPPRTDVAAVRARLLSQPVPSLYSVPSTTATPSAPAPVVPRPPRPHPMIPLDVTGKGAGDFQPVVATREDPVRSPLKNGDFMDSMLPPFIPPEDSRDDVQTYPPHTYYDDGSRVYDSEQSLF